MENFDTAAVTYVERVLKSLNIKATDLAGMIGVAQTTITRPLQPNTTYRLTEKTIFKIEEKTGIPFKETGLKSSQRAYEPANARLAYERMPKPDFDLPILGAALGGEDMGVFMDNGGHFGFAGRPANLSGVKGAYAVYTTGDSMEPRYQHGELLLVNPSKPVTKGCYVVAQLTPAQDGGDRSYLVKQFVRRSAEKLVLSQFQPEKQLTFPAQRVIAVHRIVGTAEE